MVAEDIPAFVADEYTVNIQWLYSNAIGGVKVQVPLYFAEEAKAILAYNYSDILEEEFGKEKVACRPAGPTRYNRLIYAGSPTGSPQLQRLTRPGQCPLSVQSRERVQTRFLPWQCPRPELYLIAGANNLPEKQTA